MRQILVFLCTMLLPVTSVQAAPSTISGSSALALAALVAAQSPSMSDSEKQSLMTLFEGQGVALAYPKVVVTAAGVVCRTSNVDITMHDCELTFGTQLKSLRGRAAHELFATLIEAGIPGDGAAGSLYEGLSNLSCTIDTAQVKEKDGGGASCTFTPGAP
jgi:hypothetical protein